MKKYLFTYTDTEVLTVSDAPKEGVTASGTNIIVDTLDNALIMFKAMNIDTKLIDELTNQFL